MSLHLKGPPHQILTSSCLFTHPRLNVPNDMKFFSKPSHIQITLIICVPSVIDLHERKWVYICNGNCSMIKVKGLDWGQRREWKCKSYCDEDLPVRKDSWSFMSCSILGHSLHWHWEEVIITGPIVICTILIWTSRPVPDLMKLEAYSVQSGVVSYKNSISFWWNTMVNYICEYTHVCRNSACFIQF